MREPAPWLADPGPRIEPVAAVAVLRAAARGVWLDAWDPPEWLLPHQRDAARRIAAAIEVFGGALLADAVGLGKSYIALAVATRYPSVTLVVPAALRPQWLRLAARGGSRVRLATHEALSRGSRVPPACLIVVDEAHRFRNPATRRYDRLARDVRSARVLLLSATPVVNAAADLVHLLRLFLADHALAAFGVPSLGGAPGADPTAFAHAVLPLAVARTASLCHVAHHLPATCDGSVLRIATLESGRMERLLTALQVLRFPPLGEAGRALLHRHLLLRLASSPEALVASLHRHARYLTHAIRAAARGEPLGRGAAGLLLEAGDLAQLELALEPLNAAPLAVSDLTTEEERLRNIIATLRDPGDDAKRTALEQMLAERRGRKTIVFTIARDTALALAHTLRWRRVAVATARGSRIASGPLSLEDVLARFAPMAQGAASVPEHLRIDLLIATDLVSEGLNLQDADMVVHYDLPWNPVRLAQRVGRIARLGSLHRTVEVRWFAPPDALERALRMTEIIERKARLQLALAVPVTSAVGRALVVGGVLERREMVGRSETASCRGHAVVRAPAEAICILRWDTAGPPVFELLRPGYPSGFEPDPTPLLEAAPSERALDPAVAKTLAELVRSRRCAALAPSVAGEVRALARTIALRARVAVRNRDLRLLADLDAALSRVRDGVAVGAERELRDILRTPSLAALEHWLGESPVRAARLRGPSVEVVLAGDGSC